MFRYSRTAKATSLEFCKRKHERPCWTNHVLSCSERRSYSDIPPRNSPLYMTLPAIMIAGACVFPLMSVGIIDASMPRSPSIPRTRSCVSTTAPFHHFPSCRTLLDGSVGSQFVLNFVARVSAPQAFTRSALLCAASVQENFGFSPVPTLSFKYSTIIGWS
jgi:hypothetical protein